MPNCEVCPGNSFSGGGGGFCVECPANEISNEAKSACIPCETCDVGYGLVSACNSAGDQTVCKQCEEGEYSTGGVGVCEDCGENEVSNAAKSACVPCDTCDVGYGFVSACNSAGAQTVCEMCQDGHFSAGGVGTCQMCGGNEFSNEGKSACIPCSSCPAGEGLVKHCQGSNDTLCEACEEGEYSPGGLSSCQKCKSGDFCPSNSAVRRPCAKGNYCPSFSDEIPCESGTYCPHGQLQPLECVDGASCIVPASPELALDPIRIDLLESEIKSNESLSYKISLSARPTAPVTVTVGLEVRNALCYDREGKFTLEKSVYVFEPGNHDVSQRVRVSIAHNNINYEGVFSASCHHSINTTDEDFRTAFLRPVTINLQDDSLCPSGAQQFDKNEIRKCGCREGHFIKKENPRFCDSVTDCEECPKGMICTFQQKLEEAMIEAGMYRISNDSTVVVECPTKSNCVGGATSGDGLCREGHTGPLCMVCSLSDDRRYVWSGSKCEVCDNAKRAKFGVISGVLALLLIAIVVQIYRKHGDDIATQVEKQLDSALALFATKACVKYKIVVTFTQILSRISTLYPMQLPEDFETYQKNTNVFGFLDIDLVPFNCYLEIDFHDKLLIMTLTPIAFVALVGILYASRRALMWSKGDVDDNVRRKEVQELQGTCVYIVVIALYTVFPLVSATIFQTFLFDDSFKSSGGVYLMADYKIKQGDLAQESFELYAILMGLLYCCGIPAISYLLLRKYKKAIQRLQDLEYRIANGEGLNEEHVRSLREKTDAMKKADPLLDAISPLYRDYESQYWWFEVLRFLCTLILMGLVTLTSLRGTFQIYVALLISTLMLVIFSNCHPYIHRADGVLAQSCQVSLSLAISVGLLEQAEESFKESGVSFGYMLICCVTICWAMGFLAIGLELARVFAPQHTSKVEDFFARHRLENIPGIQSSRKVTVVAPSSDGEKQSASRQAMPSNVANSELSQVPERISMQGSRLTTRVSRTNLI